MGLSPQEALPGHSGRVRRPPGPVSTSPVRAHLGEKACPPPPLVAAPRLCPWSQGPFQFFSLSCLHCRPHTPPPTCSLCSGHSWGSSWSPPSSWPHSSHSQRHRSHAERPCDPHTQPAPSSAWICVLPGSPPHSCVQPLPSPCPSPSAPQPGGGGGLLPPTPRCFPVQCCTGFPGSGG